MHWGCTWDRITQTTIGGAWAARGRINSGNSDVCIICLSRQFVLICAKRCLVNVRDNETSFTILIWWLRAVFTLRLSKFVCKFVECLKNGAGLCVQCNCAAFVLQAGRMSVFIRIQSGGGRSDRKWSLETHELSTCYQITQDGGNEATVCSSTLFPESVYLISIFS